MQAEPALPCDSHGEQKRVSIPNAVFRPPNHQRKGVYFASSSSSHTHRDPEIQQSESHVLINLIARALTTSHLAHPAVHPARRAMRATRARAPCRHQRRPDARHGLLTHAFPAPPTSTQSRCSPTLEPPPMAAACLHPSAAWSPTESLAVRGPSRQAYREPGSGLFDARLLDGDQLFATRAEVWGEHAGT